MSVMKSLVEEPMNVINEFYLTPAGLEFDAYIDLVELIRQEIIKIVRNPDIKITKDTISPQAFFD